MPDPKGFGKPLGSLICLYRLPPSTCACACQAAEKRARRTVTPAGELSGLACDLPQGRSPRAGWRFTCAEGLPLALFAARSPKRGLALIPKWEYNLAAHDIENRLPWLVAGLWLVILVSGIVLVTLGILGII